MGGGAARKLLTALATLQLLPAPTTGAHIAECTSSGAGARAGDGDDCLRHALLLDGAVALTVPGMAAARRDALQAAAACPAGSEIALPDGTSSLLAWKLFANLQAHPWIMPRQCVPSGN